MKSGLPPLADHRPEALRALRDLAPRSAQGVTTAEVAETAGLDAGEAWLAVTQLRHQGFATAENRTRTREQHRLYRITPAGFAALAQLEEVE